MLANIESIVFVNADNNNNNKYNNNRNDESIAKRYLRYAASRIVVPILCTAYRSA